MRTKRLNPIFEAASDERNRFNEALRNGAEVYLKTFSGIYKVKRVSEDFWYHTDGNGGLGQSWAGCNNGAWEDLLNQAGVKRNPIWIQ